jgi:hypothetical protein
MSKLKLIRYFPRKTSQLLLVAAAFLFPIVASAGFFGPSDYEDCEVAAAKDARSSDALEVLLGNCDDEFPARRNPMGGYLYYDPVSQHEIPVSGPKLSRADKLKIEKIHEAVAKYQKDQQTKELSALRGVTIQKWGIDCASRYLCSEKIISANIKNNSEFTIKSVTVGWVVAKSIRTCGSVSPSGTRYVRIPPKGTAVITFSTYDGPNSGEFRSCLDITSVSID